MVFLQNLEEEEDQIPEGTALTTSQTIYYYAAFNGVVCRDEAVPFVVHPLPLIDKPTDVVTCDLYTLPPLTNGNYYASSGGLGNQLNAGDQITSSQTVFVFANDGRCSNEYSFKIDIINSSNFVQITQCGSFTLPPIEVGGYYDSPNGQGKNIPAETVITIHKLFIIMLIPQLFLIVPNNLKYEITIKPLPLVDTPN